MPAHRRGAVAAKSSPVGTRNTNASFTTMLLEYPPKVGPPRYLSSPLHVKVGNDRQYCSNPARQFSQVRHESTMHPTALRSPGLNLVTRKPTRVTRPTISWPGTQGQIVLCHSC